MVIVRFASSQNVCIDFPNLKATDAKSYHTNALERKEQGALWSHFVFGKE